METAAGNPVLLDIISILEEEILIMNSSKKVLILDATGKE